MYIDRFTSEMQFPSSALSCVVKTAHGYNQVHSHEFYEMELVLRGSGTYTVDGKTYEIRRGALLFMSPAGFHEVMFSEKTKLINIMFEANMCDSRLLYALFSSKSHIWKYIDEKSLLFLETVCTELAELIEAKTDSGIFSRALLNCVASKILQLADAGQVDITADSIQKAVIYIQSNFTDGITLSDAASVTGYSPSYFSERFRSYVGETFRSYITNLRFSHAEKLLKYTDMSVTEICFECGFNNYAHFMKAFKARYKTTPVAYRKQQGIISIL